MEERRGEDEEECVYLGAERRRGGEEECVYLGAERRRGGEEERRKSRVE